MVFSRSFIFAFHNRSSVLLELIFLCVWCEVGLIKCWVGEWIWLVVGQLAEWLALGQVSTVVLINHGGVEGGAGPLRELSHPSLENALENQPQIPWVQGLLWGPWKLLSMDLLQRDCLLWGTRLLRQHDSCTCPREVFFPSTELFPGERTAPGMALGLLHDSCEDTSRRRSTWCHPAGRLCSCTMVPQTPTVGSWVWRLAESKRTMVDVALPKYSLYRNWTASFFPFNYHFLV